MRLYAVTQYKNATEKQTCNYVITPKITDINDVLHSYATKKKKVWIRGGLFHSSLSFTFDLLPLKDPTAERTPGFLIEGFRCIVYV